MNQKLSKAPLYYALAQAQFNPVPAMGKKYIGDIQDSLRKEGYTLFEQQQAFQMTIQAGPAQPPQPPQFVPSNSWLLTKPDRSAGYILSEAGIVFHTTHYDTSSVFIPELLRGLRAVHEAIGGLDHLSRLGLRYLDGVLPGEGETVEHYLHASLHGVGYAAKRLYTMNEAVFQTETKPLAAQGSLVARVHRLQAKLGFPADLATQQLTLMDRFRDVEERDHAIIDTDHFVEKQMEVDFAGIEQQLACMHEANDGIFHATVTPYALDTWR